LIALYYNALVGICEEDVANAGGGSPPASPCFFSNTQGGSQSISPYMWRNANLFTGNLINPFASGIGTYLIFSSSPVHSQISSNEWKTDLNLPLSDLITFADAAIIGQVNPFSEEEEEGGIIINPGLPGGGGLNLLNQQEDIFFNVATYLECPNGLQTLNRYEIDNVTMNWSGFFIFPLINFQTGSGVGANYPLQDSLAISNTYPYTGGFQGGGFNSNWGICGTGVLGTATSNNSSQQPINIIMIRDFRLKNPQNPPQVGQTFTVRYKVEIVNTAGQTETAFHTVVITLS
tara:strand:+ start:3933 stop:4802 length:870 start_codon:yes stop_codon:yes gene_type:complete